MPVFTLLVFIILTVVNDVIYYKVIIIIIYEITFIHSHVIIVIPVHNSTEIYLLRLLSYKLHLRHLK
jgi:hypothetical protein